MTFRSAALARARDHCDADPNLVSGSPPNPSLSRPRTLPVRPGIRSRQLADDAGLEVVNVTADSTADKGGIQPGDIIKKWDKNPMKSRAELVSRLAELSPGDEVQVLVERDGEEKIVFLKMLAPQ